MKSVNVMKTFLHLCLTCLVLSRCEGAFGFGGQKEKVLLRDISVLTLHHGKMTTAGRSSPISQLKCVGGTAGCSAFVPKVVQCYNRGSDGVDVQWECKTDMDNAYRFGEIEVSCEGFDYPDDPYVLRGSCGMEYTLDLTKEGHQQQKSGGHHNYYQDDQHHHNSYSSKSNYQRSSKGGSWAGDLILLAVIAVVIYGIYRTCIAPSLERHGDDDSRPSQDRWGSNRRQPPPPGFRSENTPGDDDGHCGSSSQSRSYGSSTNYGTGRQGSSGGASNFWTGAATGGLLGYLFGSRTNTGYHQRPYQPYGGSSWFGSGWGSGMGSGWGSGMGSGWGSGMGSSGWGSGTTGRSYSSGPSFSSGSTGTRTASGFGGTRRR